MESRIITSTDIFLAAGRVASQLQRNYPLDHFRLYGVPRGGIAPAYAVAAELMRNGKTAIVNDHPSNADVIIDDLVDSGATRERFALEYPCVPFYALFDKSVMGEPRGFEKARDARWYEFPWEKTGDASKEDIVTRLLQAVGEDPLREGLLETPARVVKAWGERFGGYGVEPADVLKVFEDGAEGVDEMVTVANIPVYSKCEHHLEDIFGVAHVAYIPSGKVVGLSKLARLVNIYARRAQVQERLTNQIAQALQDNLNPLGVGVVLECRHMCMESRGVGISGTTTITSALRGAIKDEPSARAEFLAFARSQPRSAVL